MTTSATPLRCAHIVSRYPYVSHTFVLREIEALRNRGVQVDPVTVRRPDASEVIGDAAIAEAERTHAILPTSLPELARAHLAAFHAGPAAYLRTLADTLAASDHQPRRLLWQLFYFAEAMLLWHWLCQRQISHVHAHHANVAADLAMISASFANRIGAGRRQTWSLTVHGPTELADPKGHKLALKVSRADAVIAISEFTRGQLAAMVDSPERGRFRVIHCGIDAEDYPAVAPRAEAGRPLRLLTVARLERRKGIGVLVKAMSRLKQLGVGAALTVVGDGPERDTLAGEVADLGLSEWVRFTGAVSHDRVPSFHAAADVFCLPSFSEGVPIVLMEAMASQIPVVATRVAGVPELVEDGASGMLVEAGDVSGLAEAIATLARNPALRARLGASGRRKVQAEFSLADSAVELEQMLRDVHARPA